MNKSGGSLTIERQQKKFVGEPASPTNNHKGAISKSFDSANDDDNIGGRRIYEDPQVNSIAWANNMVEAMMSDSDEEDKVENDFRDGEDEDDGGNQITISPSKKRKRSSTEDSSDHE